MPLGKPFWEPLGVSIDDIVDKEAELGEKICQKLVNKLENLSEDFFPFVKDIYTFEGDSFLERLSSLYLHSKGEFRDLYALATFADKRITPDIIYEIASTKLKGSLARRITDRTVDSTALLLPLLKADPQALRQIH
jgi:hypothetical protein